jgi:hypothetical protein
MNATLHPSQRNIAQRILLAGLAAIALGCGASTSPTSTTTTTTTTTATTTSVYPAAYKAAAWQSNTTVTFPSSCSMSYTTTGVPVVHAAYYLAPAANGQTVVATTPVSHTAMALIAYPGQSLKGNSATVNICPTAATSTTSAPMGAIGFMISGVALFNAYEATSAVALADNVSYTFTDSTGTMQTASFLDTCNSHSNGSTWHYHGNPGCVTSLVDTSTGPSHLIGWALDGYPIYGGRDMTGAVIATSQLDACNGITSVTPEFSTATYHYVLPIGVTTSQSSISCFHGTVDSQVAAMAKKLACRMPGMTTAMAAGNAPMQIMKPTMSGM